MASSSPKLSIKLLIDTKREKVLFAEASKAVIDFLFNLLCLPVGTVVRLLKKNGMVGSIGNLYKSVEFLNETYMQPDQHKDVLLKPRAHISSTEISGLLPANDGNADHNLETSLYMCYNRCYYNVSYDDNTPCPHCTGTMNIKVIYVGKKVAEEKISNSGFVREVVTYMVMDDLVVEPMSIISSITLMNKFNIKEVGALQERVVELGMVDEGIGIGEGKDRKE
ncbi:uncharacterized protein LOC133314743 [Gastrolobium bilobum]|uniref:uncharacterized protein LOC133314743 n=1 Tax=Gastrolobium bilobum TaxID=150636 RepID=UPI002AB3047A|nr:uncharacterized protein LOC133314743 [Gastrolobium bilobum]